MEKAARQSVATGLRNLPHFFNDLPWLLKAKGKAYAGWKLVASPLAMSCDFK
jgi:hypothetical protein